MAPCFGQSIPPASHPTDHSKTAYIDDEDQRPLADLKFEPSRSGVSLKLTVSATGPHVEPIAGFRGIHGTNRYTAEEFENILRSLSDFRIRTTYSDGRVVPGRLLEGSSGFLSERQVRPDGTIDYLGRSTFRFPLTVIVETDAESAGVRTTELLLDDKPRLRVQHDVRGGQVEILDVQSLGDSRLFAQHRIRGEKQKEATLLAFVPDETFKEVVKPTVSADEWRQLDREGRWVRFITDMQQNPQTIIGWREFLVEQKDFETMEWIAIYYPDGFKSYGFGDALEKQDAPQWLRVAVWHLSGPVTFGHGRHVAGELVQLSRPAISEHWLKTHQKSIENWEEHVDPVYVELQKDGHEPEDSSRYLPPLQSDEVLRYLNVPEELAQWTHQKTAEPNKVYEHQVIRAIFGVVVSSTRRPEQVASIRQLINHSNERIRQAALLGLTFMPYVLSAEDRLDDILTIAERPSEPDFVQEAALLAYSYQSHPAVILKLHDIAGDPKSVLWKPAVSRLGDIGESFSVTLLKTVDTQNMTADQQKILAGSISRINQRAPATSTDSNVFTQVRRVQLATFAEITGSPHAKTIREWAIQSGKIVQRDPDQRKQLKRKYKMKDLAPFWFPGTRGDFEKRLNEMLAESIKPE